MINIYIYMFDVSTVHGGTGSKRHVVTCCLVNVVTCVPVDMCDENMPCVNDDMCEYD